MSEPIEPVETPISIEEISIIRQVIENRKHPLDMVREQISNICAKEVGAQNIQISYYVDPQYGASFIFEDDGCGMNYSGDLKQPGRLDRFINLGFSAISGFKGDEFSWKGLGSKLAFNCRRLEIETWTKEEEGYRVIIDDPYEKLKRRERPKAQIFKLPPEMFKRKGTILKVLGYEDGKTDRNYSFDNIKNYLVHRTLLGCTRPRNLPRCVLNVLGRTEEVPTGYPFIKKQNPDEWWTVTIDPPIEKVETCSDGTEVKVVLKGGFTTETSKYNITPRNRNVGLILSVKGIPYFELDYYEFRGNLNPIRKMCNMVAECDELFEIMDLARGDYRREDEKAEAFEKALKKAVQEFTTRQEYKLYLEKARKEELKRQSEMLEDRKKNLRSKRQKYVYITGMNEPIHKEPENEMDTLAVLWKLEGMKKLPFFCFRSLDHTSARKGGIDIIADIQEEETGEMKRLVSMEVEHEFENFERHKHHPAQTSYVLCWKVSDPDILEKAVERYKYFKRINGHILQIFVISEFPGVRIDVLEKTEN